MPGETRPKKPSKDKKKKDAKTAKRHFADTGLDVRQERFPKSSRRSPAFWG